MSEVITHQKDTPTETYICDRLGEQYTRFTHPSGLSVLVFPKQMHTVSVAVGVRYGAQDTRFALDNGCVRYYPEGVAHYLEHQLFTRPDGGTVDEEFSAMGADVNAWTNYEKTVYTAGAADHFDQVPEALLRFVMQPVFTEKSVQKERGIIAQEIRMVEDDPWEKLHRRTMSALFSHHPMQRGICGSETSISRITPQTLYNCYYAFYQPTNMYLVVCGATDADAVRRMVDRVMSELPRMDSRGVKRASQVDYDRRIPVLQKRVGRASVSKPIFQIAWRDDCYPSDPSERQRHMLCMDVISELLFSHAGVLYNRLVEENLITAAYSYGYTAMESCAYHTIGGESDDPEAVYRIYCEVLDEFRKNAISYEDFERNRRVAYAGYVGDFDDTDDIADLLLDAESDGYGCFERLHLIDTLSHRQVQELFLQVLDKEHTTLTVLAPYQNMKTEGENEDD